jgi:hypothetical protein
MVVYDDGDRSDESSDARVSRRIGAVSNRTRVASLAGADF